MTETSDIAQESGPTESRGVASRDLEFSYSSTSYTCTVDIYEGRLCIRSCLSLARRNPGNNQARWFASCQPHLHPKGSLIYMSRIRRSERSIDVQLLASAEGLCRRSLIMSIQVLLTFLLIQLGLTASSTHPRFSPRLISAAGHRGAAGPFRSGDIPRCRQSG